MNVESGALAIGAMSGEKGVESKGAQKRKKIRKKAVTAAWAEPEPAVGGLVFSQKKPGRDPSNPGPGREEDGSGNWAMKVETGAGVGRRMEREA
jgi:hypothetical protein